MRAVGGYWRPQAVIIFVVTLPNGFAPLPCRCLRRQATVPILLHIEALNEPLIEVQPVQVGSVDGRLCMINGEVVRIGH
jgi:hypothetical protein